MVAIASGTRLQEGKDERLDRIGRAAVCATGRAIGHGWRHPQHPPQSAIDRVREKAAKPCIGRIDRLICIETLACEHCVGRLSERAEQISEALELVENHEIGLECIDTDGRKQVAQLSDSREASLLDLVSHPAATVGEVVGQASELSAQASIATHSPSEYLVDSRVELVVLGEQPVPACSPDAIPKQIAQTPRAEQFLFHEQPAQDCALAHLPASGLEIECRARREADKVDRATGELMDLRGQHRQPSRDREFLLAEDIEAVHVLRRDRGVRADVDDVDAVDLVVQVFEHTCNDPPGDHRLSETDLISDEESSAGRIIPVHPVEEPLTVRR